MALGIRTDGKKEGIDFHLASSESVAEWKRFLNDLYHRGLTGEGLDTICGDGSSGLIAIMPIVHHDISFQRFWGTRPTTSSIRSERLAKEVAKTDLHVAVNVDPSEFRLGTNNEIWYNTRSIKS